MSESLLQAWVNSCVDRALAPADFYSGCRKIHTGLTHEFPGLDDSLKLEHCGFTKAKLTMLRRLYWDDDHAAKVAELWRGRVQRAKYGSVSVSTYHHLTKSDPEKRSKRASVMGPCLVGISFTFLKRDEYAVDAFYRTTEWFKKFPADLVFIRDVVLPAMEIDAGQVARLRCHFANATAHVMYWAGVVPHQPNPIQLLDQIREADPRFYKWVIRWTSRYLLDEHAHGIQKFAQAMRVAKDVNERISPSVLSRLRDYCRKNHPGYDRSPLAQREEDDDGDEE